MPTVTARHAINDDTQRLLDDVAAANDALTAAHAHLAATVRRANAGGVSWTVLGTVFGVTRQAVRQRFS